MTISDEAKEKAKATRAKNEAARAARWEADAKLKEAARLALQRVFEAPDATVEQILEAARLLEKISSRY